ncbi:MAG: transglycosylase SLT domain-containing protein [Bacteroidia bacterium]
MFSYKPYLLITLSALLFSGIVPDEKKPRAIQPVSKPVKSTDYREDLITLFNAETQQGQSYVYDKELYQLRCDTLPQVKFWRSIMHLPKDSALMCYSNQRCVIHKLHLKTWNTLSDVKKLMYRDSLRNLNCLCDSEHILLVEGKSFFYDFDKAYPSLHRGIDAFIANDVDPWYAQAILLIESPNKLQKSTVGAYGPFQLMKGVARLFGLKVNNKIDERADFERAAYASSSLLKKICIPQTKEMLDTLSITYNETDLWFRLLVMHVYHAGAGNVKAALEAIKPTQGDFALIQTLWHTQAKAFKTASQNYSQLTLAAMLEMNAKLKLEGIPEPIRN